LAGRMMPDQTTRRLVGGAAFVLGAGCAALGVFYGYAAAEHYGWVLRRWAIYTAIGDSLLFVAGLLSPKWIRVAAIISILATIAAGTDPANRLARLGWDAQ
jgi:hypothetical protein